MAQSRYFRHVAPRRQQDIGSDINRGIGAGEQVGKLLGSLGAAIKGARQDAVANQLMTGQAISQQPGAGVTQDLGTLPADTGAPVDEPITLPDSSAPIAGGDDTVGSLIHTGGVGEMKARQQFEGDQLDTAIKKARLANYMAQAQGTGRYARKAATGVQPQQGSLAGWNQYQQGGSQGGQGQGRRGGKLAMTDEEGNPVDDTNAQFGTEPIYDQKVLNQHVDTLTGKKNAAGFILNNQGKISADPNNPDYSYVGDDQNNQLHIRNSDLDTIRKQRDAYLNRQGMKPYGPVDGSGASADKPIIANSQLDLAAAPPGSYVQFRGQVRRKPGGDNVVP